MKLALLLLLAAPTYRVVEKLERCQTCPEVPLSGCMSLKRAEKFQKQMLYKQRHRLNTVRSVFIVELCENSVVGLFGTRSSGFGPWADVA